MKLFLLFISFTIAGVAHGGGGIGLFLAPIIFLLLGAIALTIGTYTVLSFKRQKPMKYYKMFSLYVFILIVLFIISLKLQPSDPIFMTVLIMIMLVPPIMLLIKDSNNKRIEFLTSLFITIMSSIIFVIESMIVMSF